MMCTFKFIWLKSSYNKDIKILLKGVDKLKYWVHNTDIKKKCYTYTKKKTKR